MASAQKKKKEGALFRTNKGRGTFSYQKRFNKIGEIRRASGTNDQKTFRAIEKLMKELYDTGKHQILREVRDGIVSPLQVYAFWKEGRLEELPTTSTIRPIHPTIPDWIDTHEVAETTKRNYKSEVKRFSDLVGTTLPLNEIPEGVKRYRIHCIERDTKRTFNYLRTAMLAFLRANFGKHSELWKGVSEIRTLSATPKRQAPQLSVVEAVEFTEKLPPKYAMVARTMMMTGMHWSEITGKWHVESDRVVIEGTKAKGRNRIVPLIDPRIGRPEVGNHSFRTNLKKIRTDVSPYSFRRSFSHWMEQAEIPRIRRRMYLGHGNADVTDMYETVQIERFLHEDAKLLRIYMYRCWEERDDEEEETALMPLGMFTSKKAHHAERLAHVLTFLEDQKKPKDEQS